VSARVLDINNLSVSYATSNGELRALRDVSLRIALGRSVGIVGESGCGKSTLVSSIFRFPLDKGIVRGGEISILGRDVRGLTESGMNDLRGREIALIVQDPFTALSPVLPIGRQLVEVQHRERLSPREKRARAIAALQDVGIDDAADRMQQYPHQFSGGILQRICIAMALLVRPALLVADEPTTALDATTEVQIVDLLRRVRVSTGASLLIVSHHLSVIVDLCDHVAVMYAGEIVEQGEVQSVFGNPMHPYTRLLIECDPALIHGRLDRLPSIPGNVTRVIGAPSGCVFAPRCPQVQPECAVTTPRPVHAHGRYVQCHLYGDGDDH
jgi:peptide/nickel transport system ATP-binding protein